MANKRVHRAVGAVAGGVLALALSRGQTTFHRIIELIGGAIAGLFFGLLPDIFEPPHSPNHRRLIHGALPNAVLIAFFACRLRPYQSSLRSQADHQAALAKQAQTTVSKAWHLSLEFLCRLLSGATAGALAGYGSHLALDVFTPRSLPPIA